MGRLVDEMQGAVSLVDNLLKYLAGANSKDKLTLRDNQKWETNDQARSTGCRLLVLRCARDLSQQGKDKESRKDGGVGLDTQGVPQKHGIDWWNW